MGVIPPGDLTLLRQPVDTQKTVERLYTVGFTTMWTGRVNDVAVTRGTRSITYDGGAMAAGFNFSPDLDTYGPGLEVWFGSSAGDDDRGRRRLRSMGAAAAAGTMVVDWYDDMELADDDYITIKLAYSPWPKYSWFTATGPQFRKDGPDGTLYAASGDANDTPAPHVIMGRHFAAEMPAAGSIAIQCNASQSVDVAGGGGGATYAWALTPSGGGSFDNAALSTPVLTINTEGRYWIHCTVTIDGRSTTGHRAVVVGGGITEFSRGPITSQYDRTDIACQISSTSPDTGSSEIRPQVDWSDYEDHALVIIAADDWYGSTNKCIGFHNEAWYTDRECIVFCGYLLLENDDLVDDGSGLVEMQAVSLVDMFLYSLSLTGVSAAGQWYEMNQSLMTVAGNLLHLFRWQSTLLDIADWWLPWTDTVRRSANEEFSEGDMLERARALARARVMGVTANPQGEVFVETDLNTRSAADRAVPPATKTLTLTEADIADVKRARLRRRGDVVRVLADGGYSSGVMGSFQPFFSASQDVARADGRPALVHVDRLMLPTQVESNRLAGRLAAVANRKYIEVNLDFSGNYRGVFGPDSQQWTDLGSIFAGTLRANLRADTGLVDALAVPRQVTHSHDNATGHTTVTATFDVEAPVELDGVTITPPVVPSEDPGDFTWDFPGPPDWPSLPPNEAAAGPAYAADDALGVYYMPGGYTWSQRNGGLTPTDTRHLIWDPWWKVNQGSTNPENAVLYWTGAGFLRRSTNGGNTWTELVTTIDDPPNNWGDATAPTAEDLTYVQIHGDPHNNGTFYVLAEWQEPGGDWRAWVMKTDDHFATQTWQPLGGAGLTGSFSFDTGTEGWGFTDETGDGSTGNWSGTVGRTAVGSLQSNIAPDTVPPFTSSEGYWSYPPAAGLMVATGDTFSAWVNQDGDGTSNNYVTFVYTDSTFRNGNVIHNAVGWNQSSLTVPAGDNGKTLLYIRVQNDGGAGAAGMTAFWDDINFSISGNEVRPLAMDLDSEDGTRLYVTVWDGANLWLRAYDSDLIFQRSYDFSTATEGEVAAKTYWAVPRCPSYPGTASFGDYVYVMGRMSGAISHLALSTDAGATFSDIDTATWAATERIGALSLADGPNTLLAFVNHASAPTLWKTTDAGTSWGQINTLPFSTESEAASRHPSGTILIANNDSAGAIRAAVLEAPYIGDWTDATGVAPDDLPDAGAGSTGFVTAVWIT